MPSHKSLGSTKRNNCEETKQRQLKSIVMLSCLQTSIQSFYKDQTCIPLQTLAEAKIQVGVTMVCQLLTCGFRGSSSMYIILTSSGSKKNTQYDYPQEYLTKAKRNEERQGNSILSAYQQIRRRLKPPTRSRLEQKGHLKSKLKIQTTEAFKSLCFVSFQRRFTVRLLCMKGDIHTCMGCRICRHWWTHSL